MDTGSSIFFWFGLAGWFFLGGVTTSLPSRQNPAKGEVEELPIYNTEPPKKKNREPPLRNPRKLVPKGFGWIVFQGFCCHDFREGKFFFMWKTEGKNPVGPGIWQEPH